MWPKSGFCDTAIARVQHKTFKLTLIPKQIKASHKNSELHTCILHRGNYTQTVLDGPLSTCGYQKSCLPIFFFFNQLLPYFPQSFTVILHPMTTIRKQINLFIYKGADIITGDIVSYIFLFITLNNKNKLHFKFIFELGGISKHLMTSSSFYFPLKLNISINFAHLRNIEVSRRQTYNFKFIFKFTFHFKSVLTERWEVLQIQILT